MRFPAGTRPESRRQSGVALIVVLLTLMALLVLCTPFLLTVRNADQASASVADRVQVELALDAAGRIATARLGASHSALDATPDYDSLAELGVQNAFKDPNFVDANDPRGTMFDLEVSDVSGRIDLNTAPPQVIGNLMEATAVTVTAFAPTDDEVRLTSAGGFLDAGFFWINGELVGYASKEGSRLTQLVRALGIQVDEEGNVPPCGPRPARGYDANTVVIDQRAWALAQWRAWTPDGVMRKLDSIEALTETLDLIMAGEMGEEALDRIHRAGTVYSDIGAGRPWQHGSRIVNTLTAGEDCTLLLNDPRWFNAGTTVRITDGQTTELGIVRSAGNGRLVLTDPVASDYERLTAVVEPLARRPVNINTASEEVLEALLLNLQLAGRQSRITPREVDDLVAVITESRPFTSFEDFARRVVMPAGGFDTLPSDAPVVPDVFQVEEGLEGAEAAASIRLIDEDDARALYKNALNANDGELGFSTMPFAFVSTDVHRMDLRATVNAPSGVERARASREQVEHIVPQRDLLFVATRQEDFEQLFRLDREAPGWATLPLSTSRHDDFYGASPPPRSSPHLGVHDTLRADDPTTEGYDTVFASRDPEQDGFAMPWAMREQEVGRRAGRMLHFDDETLSLEGRYLPTQPIAVAPSTGYVDWQDSNGLLRPFHFSMWVKPAELSEGALFLDVGGVYNDADRASLTIEDGDLVFKLFDGAGDHPTTAFEEVSEARYALAPGDGPGMPVDTWIHVSLDVRGSRPDQIVMLVDGRWSSTQPGLTRLTGALSPDAAVITVESTEGFPDQCVLRIGDELVEATRTGGTTFQALYNSQGESAGFGGRLARVRFTGPEPTEVPQELIGTAGGFYQAGTAVELYGYSLRISGNASNGVGSLASDIGNFAVGRIIGMNSSGSIAGPEPVDVQLDAGFTFTIGTGLETQDAAIVQLAPADPGMTAEQVMAAFDPNGGFAVLMTVSPGLRITNGQTNQVSEPTLTTENVRIGGVEVVHYSGWSGNELTIDQRGDAVQLPNMANAPPEMLGRGAFVFDWADNIITSSGATPDERLTWQTKIFPISMRVGGAATFATLGGEENSPANPRLAQITRLGAESGLTEWVRYDYNNGTDLVRDDPNTLGNVWFAAQAGQTTDNGDGTAGGPPGGGGGSGGGGLGGPGAGGGGGGGVGGGGLGGAGGGLGGGLDAGPPPFDPLSFDPPVSVAAAAPAPAPAPPAVAAPPVDGSYWHYRIGEEETAQHVVTRSVRSHLQFRGVCGTFDHAHPAGAVVLPVFEMIDEDVNSGRPGRFDAVTFLDSQPSDPGFVGMVHHVHRPTEYTVYNWQEGGDPLLEPVAGAAPTTAPQPAGLTQGIQIALMEQLAVPIAGGTAFGDGQTDTFFDTRIFGRMNKFPSGELPRTPTGVAVGGSYSGSGAGLPAATVDELVFGNSTFGVGDDTHGAQVSLSAAVDETSNAFSVWPNSMRTPWGSVPYPGGTLLSNWPADGGLVRIGDELIAYQGYDSSSGTVAVAESGRGMLGTDPQPHAAGEPVSLLEHIPVSILTAGVGAGDAYLQLASLDDFPSEGLVRIQDELIHFTWQDGAALGMPSASAEPGKMDREGAGLFRARFGTNGGAYGAGVPVVLQPFRYWDRWNPNGDAPEMHYLGAAITQPDAFWRTVFFDVEEADGNGPRLGVLLRTDPEVPWDAPAEDEADLNFLYEGMPGGKGIPVGVQSDLIEWRVFVQYDPGAFDPVTGASHGWKMSPRLRFLGAEYMAPSRILRRVSR